MDTDEHGFFEASNRNLPAPENFETPIHGCLPFEAEDWSFAGDSFWQLHDAALSCVASRFKL
jgi:hypothetical protein